MSITTLVGKMFGSGDNQVSTGPGNSGSKGHRPVQRMQYCVNLQRDKERPTAGSMSKLWKLLEQDMAVVPSGPTHLVENSVVDAGQIESNELGAQRVEVDSFYVDKTTVTNADYAQFVKAGGYEATEFWSQDIWSQLLQFVDQTGSPGPKFWQNGKPLKDKLEHPVVGICWYEADAFARWCGKQLPDAGQWQRAACWHTTKTEETSLIKFPWGDTFETQFANAWASGIGDTVAVENYYKGSTPNGVYQLIGNVWEMTGNRFVFHTAGNNTSDLIEIRGGAFDTYLDCQMTCQFRTGQTLLARSPNVGFRCVARVSDLHRPE